MEMNLKIGQIVRSKAGRDQNRYMVVVAVEDEFVFLCDGDMRKADSPKKKKIKHVAKTNHIAEDIVQKLQEHGKLSNAQLRKALVKYNFGDTEEG